VLAADPVRTACLFHNPGAQTKRAPPSGRRSPARGRRGDLSRLVLVLLQDEDTDFQVNCGWQA